MSHNTSNASLPHLAVLLQTGFILASEEHVRLGTKAEAEQKRGIVPINSGGKVVVESCSWLAAELSAGAGVVEAQGLPDLCLGAHL